MIKYAAFLRGINVGGNKIIKMTDLKKTFESLKFKNVQTLLASGNIIFEAPETDSAPLEKKIEEKLKNNLNHSGDVIVRKFSELRKFADSDPFQNIPVTEQTRLYVTFLKEKTKTKLPIPYESPEKDFRILTASHTEVCSVLTVSPHRRSIDAMSILEKEFGRRVTTRNWNTVLKILKK